ncbi:hypothetical protein [Streptomyces sp. NRRL S-87]|uniref:hypothetical protein n=1 Tax=Streptomyces sp. NRRL S-87 TaxID=1463920 RepID=UPI0004C286A6|nr:hypothetical protein [Streptomyces sp. NRRL S-87]
MSTHRRTVAVRAAAVTALAASVLALPASVALADTSTAGHRTAHARHARQTPLALAGERSVVVAKPLAAVQAGMQSLRPGVAADPYSGPGDGVLMIGAGAGMAAVGAAGLGFAMLRRGRTYGVRD